MRKTGEDMSVFEKPSILVVDDDPAHRTMLRTLLAGWGYSIHEADDGDTAVRMAEERPFDLILMDIRMVRVSGSEALKAVKAYNPAIPVIIMTAYSSVETAVETLKNGAYDYLTKPLDFDELRHTVERAMDHTRLREENRRLRKSLGEHFDRRNIIGRSAAMMRILETVSQVAPSEATVLISGESGTGKEMIAVAIHHNSSRKDGSFVKINCAAITETLLESELFGHEKGAFTGAHRRKEGRFRQAHGGSLFLDEISEMSPAMQVKLLRVLQEREISRVGGEEAIPVDVRIIAATNRDLFEAIQSGRFREDLYYRLNVVSIAMPPLRNRREDIPLLAQHFLERLAEANNKDIQGLTPQAMDTLLRHDWPGNVRELVNAMERAVIFSRSRVLDAKDLSAISGPGREMEKTEKEGASDNLSLEALERAAILRTLEETGGNKSEAARRLGITRKTLHKRLQKYRNEP